MIDGPSIPRRKLDFLEAFSMSQVVWITGASDMGLKSRNSCPSRLTIVASARDSEKLNG